MGRSQFRDLTIVVPSAGRHTRVGTLSRFEDRIRDRIYLAVPQSQAGEYIEASKFDKTQKPGKVLAIPDSVKGIAKTRQWLTEWCPTKFLMQVSDDVKFYRRLKLNDSCRKSRTSNPSEVTDMLLELLSLMNNGAAHSGPDRYFGNHQLGCRINVGYRLYDVYCHNVRILEANGIRWDRISVMEDFDVNLQLLAAGFPSYALVYYTWSPTMKSNAPGGCSSYRTPLMQKQAAISLAKLHPGIVRVVQKTGTKSWSNGFNGERWDVVVQWKKALRQGGFTSA